MVEFTTDNSFDFNNTSAYTLSIQVSLDGFSFFILNKEENRLLAWQKTTATISNENFVARRLLERIESEELLLKSYDSVEVTYFSDKFIQVPEDFFEEKKKKSLFRLMFPRLANQKIISCRTQESQPYLLCAIPDNLGQLLVQQFSNYSLVHPIQHLSTGLQKMGSASENRVAIWLGSKEFFITVIRNSRVQLVNRFNFVNADDVLYYTVSALKQLEISPQKSSLYLSGHLDKMGNLVVKLNKYFGLVDFLKPGESLMYDAEKLDIPKHQLISLF